MDRTLRGSASRPRPPASAGQATASEATAAFGAEVSGDALRRRQAADPPPRGDEAEADADQIDSVFDRRAASAPSGATAGYNLRFETKNLPEAHRWEAWASFHEPMWSIYPKEQPTPSSFAPSMIGRWLGPLSLGWQACPPQTWRRGPYLGRESKPDALMLLLFSATGTRGLFNGQPIELSDNAFHLTDWRPLHGDMPRSQVLHVWIPYATIGYDPSLHPQYIELPRNSPGGRMLAACLSSLLRETSFSADGENDIAAAKGLTGLLRGVLFPASADEEARASMTKHRAAAIRRYVDAHATERTLTAEQVGRAVGASRATVYRAFAAEGGLERAIRDRRLRAALSELSLSPQRRGLITEVAERWGFPDPAQFARDCRRRFGCAPTDVVGLAAASSSDMAPAGGDGGRRSSALADFFRLENARRDRTSDLSS